MLLNVLLKPVGWFTWHWSAHVERVLLIALSIHQEIGIHFPWEERLVHHLLPSRKPINIKSDALHVYWYVYYTQGTNWQHIYTSSSSSTEALQCDKLILGLAFSKVQSRMPTSFRLHNLLKMISISSSFSADWITFHCADISHTDYQTILQRLSPLVACRDWAWWIMDVHGIQWLNTLAPELTSRI